MGDAADDMLGRALHQQMDFSEVEERYRPRRAHIKVEFTRLVTQTDKAYLFLLPNVDEMIWFPKAVCADLDPETNHTWISRSFFNMKMKEYAKGLIDRG